MATKLANTVFTAIQADLQDKGLSNPNLESLVYDFLAEVLESSTSANAVNSASDWADFELFELQAQGW